jgi:hypothetical protein
MIGDLIINRGIGGSSQDVYRCIAGDGESTTQLSMCHASIDSQIADDRS